MYVYKISKTSIIISNELYALKYRDSTTDIFQDTCNFDIISYLVIYIFRKTC